MTRGNSELIDISHEGLVRDKKSGKMMKRKKAKPMWMIERDREVIRLMHILQDPARVCQKVNSMPSMTVKGRKLGLRRLHQIISEYRDQASFVKPEDVNDLVWEAKERYTLLINEAMMMIAESYAVKDTEAKLKAKALALERARQAQQALDNLLKMSGIYKEQKDININVNIRESDEWIKLEEAFLLFFKYGLDTPIDPMKFLEFIEKCENDPIYLQNLKNRTKEELRKSSDGTTEILEIINDKVIDTEYKDVDGEDGDYEQTGQYDIAERDGAEEKGDQQGDSLNKNI